MLKFQWCYNRSSKFCRWSFNTDLWTKVQSCKWTLQPSKNRTGRCNNNRQGHLCIPWLDGKWYLALPHTPGVTQQSDSNQTFSVVQGPNGVQHNTTAGLRRSEVFLSQRDYTLSWSQQHPTCTSHRVSGSPLSPPELPDSLPKLLWN